jgi:hypothetical protein
MEVEKLKNVHWKMNNFNIFIIKFYLCSLLFRRISGLSNSQAKLNFRFNLLQKRFDNLFINIIVWFQYKQIMANGLTSLNAIPYKSIKATNIRINRKHKMWFELESTSKGQSKPLMRTHAFLDLLWMGHLC